MPKEIERGSTSLALKSGFWYVASTFITKGLAFITTPIFARLMSPNDYGEFSNFANWQSLLIIIASGEMYNTLSRAYYDYRDDYDEYASTITIMGGILTFAFYLFFLANSRWIFKLVAIPPQFLHLMFFSMLFQGVRQVYLTKERTLYKYRSVAFISMLSLVIPTLLSIIIVYNVPEVERLAARMYGFYVPYALIGVYCTCILMKTGICFKTKYIKYAVVLAAPLLVHYLTTYILSSTNTIITKSIIGADTAAIVSITTSIMNILTILFQSVTGAMTTFIMDNLESKKYEKIRNCILFFALGGAIISIAIILFGPEVVKIIGGRKYYSAVALIPGSVLAVYFQILTSILAIILTYDKNVVKTAVATSVIATISVVMKILFLKSCGYEVLPIINTTAFVLTMIVNYMLVCRAGYGICINYKGILGVIVVMVVLSISATILYQYNWLRYLFICAISISSLAVLVITRNNWIMMIRRRLKKIEK